VTQIHFKVCVILITKNRYIFVINLSVSTCFSEAVLKPNNLVKFKQSLTSTGISKLRLSRLVQNHKHPHLSVVKLLKSCVENMFSFQLLVNALR
jgi:hypothetical protein